MKQQKYFNNPRANTQVRNRREADRLINASYQTAMILSIIALREVYGFGTVRTERYIDKVKELLDSYNSGTFTVEDCRKRIKEELDIEIK